MKIARQRQYNLTKICIQFIHSRTCICFESQGISIKITFHKDLHEKNLSLAYILHCTNLLMSNHVQRIEFMQLFLFLFLKHTQISRYFLHVQFAKIFFSDTVLHFLKVLIQRYFFIILNLRIHDFQYFRLNSHKA